MANQLKPASTFIPSRSPIADQNGMATWSFIQILIGWDTKLNNGLNSTGQLIGNIDPATRVLPRTEGLGITLQHISNTGVVESDGLFSATPLAQGAVFMPTGAADNHLGTAAIEPATAFDSAGSAAAAQANAEAYANTVAGSAQSNAEAHADAVAATAQSNAEAFSSNASNLTSGTVATARLGGLTATVTTAALTVGGTQGSMTFTNGLLTAQVQAT
jgi:tetrahydromethanopterin S-methyltransferase subunit F